MRVKDDGPRVKGVGGLQNLFNWREKKGMGKKRLEMFTHG
jgi:hypothetical protein